MDQIVEGAQGFLLRRERIEAVDLIEIDVIGSQTAEARVAGFEDVAAGGSGLIWAGPGSEETLCGEDDVLTARAEGLADYFLRLAAGVGVGGVDQVHAGFKADLHQAPRLVHLHVAHCGEASFTAERHGAEAQHRNFQSTTT